MLRYILIFALGALAANMFAQSDLLNLSFGMSYEQAERQLLEQGFMKQPGEGNVVEFVPKKSAQVRGMQVYVEPREKKLVGWLIAFKPDPKVDLKGGILDLINKAHGQYEYFSALDTYIWTVDDTRQIVSYTDKTQDGFQVLYMDSRYEQYF
jgi:hypothetical protein